LCIGFLIPIALLDGAASDLVPENPGVAGMLEKPRSSPRGGWTNLRLLSMARQFTPEAIVVKRHLPP